MIGRINKFKMLESYMNGMEENNKGIKHLLEGKLDEAENYFRSRIENGTYRDYYGLATAIFKRDVKRLSKEETEEIIRLYEKSIEERPDFADAYLMCGMAYEKLSSIFLHEYKKNPLENGDKKIENIKWLLNRARELITKSIEINPSFTEAAISELEGYDRRIKNIDRLKEYFEKDRN